MDEEILFHLNARTEQLVRQGLSPEQARLEASRRFGSLVQAREGLHRSTTRREKQLRIRQVADIIRQDVRIAFRGLRRSPGFVAVAVLCLALGIGANAAIYSVINAVLFRPLPFAEPSRLVRIWPNGAVPPGVYDIVRKESRSFDGLAGYVDGHKVSVNTGSSAPMRYVAADVTANLFDVLGVRATLGRTFLPGDNLPGRNDIVILSHSVWREHFGADPRILGSSITIDGIAHSVVGVMPVEFRFPSADVDVWTPSAVVPADPSFWWGTPLRLVGRLKAGISTTQAHAEAAIVFARARGAFPMKMGDDWGKNVDVVSLRESLVGESRPTLLLLFAAVGLVLMIACVNVAILYVDRSTAREHEIAVRAALGAGRIRVVAQVLTESVIVAMLGATAGLLLATTGVHVLVAMLPADTPRAEEIAVDGHVLAFTLALALLSALLFGMLPVRRATRLDVQSTLRSGGRHGSSPRRLRATRMLAMGQVALAVVIVTAAGLLIKSFWRLHKVDLGFDSYHVLSTDVPLPSFESDTLARAPAFYDALLTRARIIPGVQVAAAASAMPFGASAYPAAMEVEAHQTPVGGSPLQPIRTTVTPDYFRALSIPLLRGRSFTDTDRAGAPAVAIIDASAATILWPNQDALGQRIRYVWDKSWFTIVGIVGDVKRDSLSGVSQPSVYLPMAQSFAQEMSVVVRVSSDADIANISRALRTSVAEVDKTVPVTDVRLLDHQVTESAAHARFSATLLVLFASIALLLGAAGIYGVTTATVTRRTREIGVRMALGASSNEVMQMVLKEVASFVLVGVLLGVAGAIAAGRLLRGMLFGVGALDLPVLSAVACLLAAVALLAAFVPARKASQVHPVSAMRAE
ncbi:MAG: ABC transporter permease [Gemmatimonadota bacterium]|nr:ABC transporter permease [Gemmatimonadota bacterium]